VGAHAANRVPGKREAHGPDAGARASERRAGIINRQQRRVTRHRKRILIDRQRGQAAAATLLGPVELDQVYRYIPD